MSVALSRLTPSDVDPDRIRQVTDEVLRRPMYDAATPAIPQRVLQWLLDVVGRLIELIGLGGRAEIVGTAILVLAVGATVLIAVLLLRRIRRDPGTAAPVAGIGGRSADDWRELARRAEAARDWSEALRCTYRALLAELVAAGVTDEVAGRTAREYLRDVSAAAPEAEAPLTGVTTAFEATWYGRRPTTAADVEAVRADADRVLRATLVTR